MSTTSFAALSPILPKAANAQRAWLASWRARGLVGVDEAGRGPLAGPVCAAAVVLPPDFERSGIDDSKKLSASRRQRLAERIHSGARSWAIGWATATEIDQLNILNATLLAMRRAVVGLRGIEKHLVLIDGNRQPVLEDLDVTARTLIGGDALVPDIGAASILAKVARDEYMQALDERWPGYGFARHKGYGTAAHCAALNALGPCDEHRRSFAPVRDAIIRGQPQ